MGGTIIEKRFKQKVVLHTVMASSTTFFGENIYALSNEVTVLFFPVRLAM